MLQLYLSHMPVCAHFHNSHPQERMYNHALNKTTECKGKKITKGKYRANISGVPNMFQNLWVISFNSQNIPMRYILSPLY